MIDCAVTAWAPSALISADWRLWQHVGTSDNAELEACRDPGDGRQAQAACELCLNCISIRRSAAVLMPVPTNRAGLAGKLWGVKGNLVLARYRGTDATALNGLLGQGAG